MRRTVQGLRVVPVLAGVVCVGASFATLSAQVAAPDAPRRAAASQPVSNWWDTPAQPAPSAQSPGAGQSAPLFPQNYPRPYASSITDYPSVQMGDWVTASAMAARARMMLSRAESELDQTIRRVQQRFEHSEEYTKASNEEKQTYATYVAARQQVIVGLFNDPKYHAIMQLRDELSDKITDRRASHNESISIDFWLTSHGFNPQKLTGEQMVTLKAMYDADMRKAADDDTIKEDILALATLKMQYASDARGIEVTALDADDNLKGVREKMITASRHLSDLRAQFDFSLRDNPEVLVARRNLEDARVTVVEAQTLATSAAIASDYALNYSYFLHRNDNNGLSNGYGTPAGYSTPYWGH